MSGSSNSRDWNDHILVVFSILAAFTLDKSFDELSRLKFDLAQGVMFFGVFYILLENWYHVHKDLMIFDISLPSEVVFYVLTTLTFSFLPFIYGKRTIPLMGLDGPDWLMINLLLILLVDSTRRIITARKLSFKGDVGLTISQKRLVGEYAFYGITGYAYLMILFVVFMSLHGKATLHVSLKAGTVIGIWGLIRVSDVVLVSRASRYMARIFLDD